MNILFFGPPGVGKGTQADILAKEFNIPNFSTGEMFRKHMAEKTEIGKQIIEIMDSGNLVGDDIVNEMVKQTLDSYTVANGFILDGYPRNTDQVEYLDSLLNEINIELDFIFHLSIPKNICLKRIKKRALIQGRKEDADPQAIKTRYDIYFYETFPCLMRFKKKNWPVIKINGNGSVKKIHDKIMESIA